MPVVTCPQCESKYDPGMDEELERIDTDQMSPKVVCPVCAQWLRLTDASLMHLSGCKSLRGPGWGRPGDGPGAG